jgi:hypothetical protein
VIGSRRPRARGRTVVLALPVPDVGADVSFELSFASVIGLVTLHESHGQ